MPGSEPSLSPARVVPPIADATGRPARIPALRPRAAIPAHAANRCFQLVAMAEHLASEAARLVVAAGSVLAGAWRAWGGYSMIPRRAPALRKLICVPRRGVGRRGTGITRLAGDAPSR